MGIVELAADPRATAFAARLVRFIPTGLALRLADMLARRAANQVDSPVIRALRQNQAVVRGLPVDDPSLDQAAFKALQITTRGYVHLFKNLGKSVETRRAVCVIDEPFINKIVSYYQSGQGVFVVGFHMAGFDQVIVSLGTYGFPLLGLTYADPNAVYRFQNQVRLNCGVNVMDITPQSLRQGLRYLRQGNVVMTACDRPDPLGEELVFFGRKARLPVGHARLALHAGVPLVVGVTRRTGEGTYAASMLDIFEPYSTGNDTQDAIDLSQRVITVFEAYLRQHPEEWLMFFPVWGENHGDPSG
jgi:lauroyl/myristoyl acyltransferase